MLLAECGVSLRLAGRCPLEKPEPLLERGSVRWPGCGAGPLNDHADNLAGRLPLQVVAGTNLVLLGDRLRKRQLKLAGNFRHDPKYSKDSILVSSL
jgi:hypothetical protein